jgi:hypothetical protein
MKRRPYVVRAADIWPGTVEMIGLPEVAHDLDQTQGASHFPKLQAIRLTEPIAQTARDLELDEGVLGSENRRSTDRGGSPSP